MTNQVSGQSSLELSTIYFFKDSLPASIPLHHCGLPLREAISNSISAYYGYQSRLEGVAAASEYAEQHGVKFTAIDFSVALDNRPNLQRMAAQDLQNFDFLSFSMMSSSMVDEIVAVMKEGLQARGLSLETFDFKRPYQILARYPSLVYDLQSQPSWEHIKVIAHPAQLIFGDCPYNVATLPYRYWDRITEVFCRTDPLRVSLKTPPATVRFDAGSY
ncbi:MAG: hypothetical protein JHC61_03465 [Burkholderiaceae bacterium]|nr:hypothetical protein [Burkholderiaceae bacterium]